MRLSKGQIIESSGSLQVCAGHESGCEAAIHAMSELFNKPETEAVLLVDATNAFNCLNRKVALQNIKVTCPIISTYLNNTYKNPATLHVGGSNGHSILYSQEGTTQGDPAAMGFYASSTTPIIVHLNESSDASQAWFADDATSAGSITDLLVWWEELQNIGPGFGYFPNPQKTVLIVKPHALDMAKDLFGNSGVVITSEGKRHLGAVIGSKSYRTEYHVSSLVNEWITDVQSLSKIAESDPHAAYTAFTFGMVHKWSFFQRTIPDTSELYQPLEDAIRNAFIPSITGRSCSILERDLFSLPCHLGGLGIPDPTKTADMAFSDSLYITQPLTDNIIARTIHISSKVLEQVESRKLIRKALKVQNLREKSRLIQHQLPDHLRRATVLNSEKGASIWLTSLPLLSYGFYLNKREFVDALCLRYNWRIEGTTRYCVCGEQNTVNHALICPNGGFVIMRHNELRDIEAELLNEVCNDVTIEPQLLPLTGEHIRGIQSPEARLDVSARSFWAPLEKAYFDVRVFQ